jgi:hypothetical protein
MSFEHVPYLAITCLCWLNDITHYTFFALFMRVQQEYTSARLIDLNETTSVYFFPKVKADHADEVACSLGKIRHNSPQPLMMSVNLLKQDGFFW